MTPSAATTLRQVQVTTQALRDEGHPEEAWAVVFAALDTVLTRNAELELLVAKLQGGPRTSRSERIDPAQLSLLRQVVASHPAADLVVDPEADAQVDAHLDREIAEAEARAASQTRRRRRRTAPGWTTRGVRQEVHTVAVPPAERVCPTCHREQGRIGVDRTRRLAFVPAHFVEHVYHREKYACAACKAGVTTAAGPPAVIERSAATPSVLAHVVVSKYVDHTPLHRLHRIYARHGADIPVSTLADWIAAVGDLVAPLVTRLAARLDDAYIVRTDATGLKVLDPTTPAHIHRGTMWAVIGDDRDVIFRYTPTGEGATGPWDFLAGRTGYIHADAATVFDRLFTGEAATAIELGCWAHARRKLVALQEVDARVAYPLTRIARLYRIEHLADARALLPDARATLRQERSQGVLDQLQRWYHITATHEPPRADLTKAAAYAINHWTALTRFVADGRVSLDNNLCEQQLRDIALGRKNYLFAGSHDAARRAANLYSLTRTCAQYRVPVWPYLTDVLDKLAAGWTTARLDELLPPRWVPPDPPSPSPRQ